MSFDFITYKLTPSNTPIINNNTNYNISFSNNIAYPELSTGFNFFLHKTKDILGDEYKRFNNKKKVYLVTSQFEKNIDKLTDENGIVNTTIEDAIYEFILNNIKVKLPKLLSRAYLKLWEMIYHFDLIDNTNDFISVHLAEGPGSFIQATIYYREYLASTKKIKSSKNDKYYGITLHSDNEHLHLEKAFLDYYNNEKPQRLKVFETVNVKELEQEGGGLKSNGDLTKLNTVLLFGGSDKMKGFAEKANLITADGGFDWKNENLQEQEAYKLIFGQILTALKTQNDKGHFVLKIFETFTRNSFKLIEILKVFYKEVHICKPFTSRASNSEKYVVCKFFDSKKFTSSISKNLEDMLSKMEKNSDFNIVSLFNDYFIEDNIFNEYKKINIDLLQSQYKAMSDIINFINLENYSGSEFHNYHSKQIIATNFWINTFLSNKDNKDKNEKDIKKDKPKQSRTKKNKTKNDDK
jgi:23S rRNA U2552 (ribose-2'-O)-methylase RlmE/FtsJ